jgi:hypothetical protein
MRVLVGCKKGATPPICGFTYFTLSIYSDIQFSGILQEKKKKEIIRNCVQLISCLLNTKFIN